MPISKTTKKQPLSFSDVLKFAAGYWVRQPKKLSLILAMVLTAAFLETYLPNALASFLTSMQQNQGKEEILYRLSIFLGTYLAQALLFSVVYLIYNSFETNIFKSLVDDVFAHVYRLPEKFFANTFTGGIVSKINRARQKIEVFEDQILVRIFPTIVVLVGSIVFLTFKFPMLGVLILGYLLLVIIISSFLVFRVSS